MKFKKIVYASKFDGLPRVSDFEIVENDVPDDLRDYEFLYKALYISCDPYLRVRAHRYVRRNFIEGYQLSKVIKSNNEKYPVGSILVMNARWRSGGIGNGSGVLYRRDDLSSKLPMSAGIGIFGMTGLAAYHGVKRILKPKAGDTILVSGAAGGVGTVVGQIGKILQCRVIGSCGSKEKIKFAKSVGYDDAFNYKTETVKQALQRLAPDGVDGYFDNIGGDFASEVLLHMKRKGKVAVCGAISSYNATEPVRALIMQPMLYSKSIIMEGFNMVDCTISPRDDEIYAVLRKWVDEGKLKQYEYLTEGFESLPSAFIGMLQGKNLGKTVVKI